jgi:hypothetical protein
MILFKITDKELIELILTIRQNNSGTICFNFLDDLKFIFDLYFFIYDLVFDFLLKL